MLIYFDLPSLFPPSPLPPFKVLPPKKRKIAASTDEGKKGGEGGKDADADKPIYDASNIGDRIQVYWDRDYKWYVWGARRGRQVDSSSGVVWWVWCGVWCVMCRCVVL